MVSDFMINGPKSVWCGCKEVVSGCKMWNRVVAAAAAEQCPHGTLAPKNLLSCLKEISNHIALVSFSSDDSNTARQAATVAVAVAVVLEMLRMQEKAHETGVVATDMITVTESTAMPYS
ncbi:hypothetical protein PIB30_086388 [Stylosanthes scabra]|uniref:VAN3-binding protein-like auxin canalisation domain-containing protein n=1 Tax=Stylosanthes scabra TaxID=79078 RepID=A0ABU6WSW5_9FABA|nr:hypothetical protein [Stylosanthes scabra]